MHLKSHGQKIDDSLQQEIKESRATSLAIRATEIETVYKFQYFVTSITTHSAVSILLGILWPLGLSVRETPHLKKNLEKILRKIVLMRE